MIPTYNRVPDAKPYEQWLDEVVLELAAVGLPDTLTVAEDDWFRNTWDLYDLSPSEAVICFINETPAP
jgi:hypothetical protein